MSLLDNNKLNIGHHYETLAQDYLARQGLVFIEKNYRKKCGEIDLIMRERNEIIFIEVKYRKQQLFGSALEAVTFSKQQKLKRTAMLWLQKNRYSPHHTYFRFDVIAISGENNQIDWIKNAITEG
jgi:putative endonuclease